MGSEGVSQEREREMLKEDSVESKVNEAFDVRKETERLRTGEDAEGWKERGREVGR